MQMAAAYIRVSTDDQLELSPDSQIKLIREYAKKNDMIIPDEFIFVDEGISGKTAEKRPAFNRMIGTAKMTSKPFDCILLWKFSRFARNREDSILYKSMLRKQLGIDVISITENVGDDKMSILIEALIEAMDEYYSINLAEEVKRGMTEKAQRGGCVAGPALGYDVVDGKYVINDDGAELVRQMFHDYNTGMGMREIAINLNAKGVKTSRGNAFENRTIEYILRNPLYMGKIRWNPSKRTRRDYADENIIVTDGIHEPIIAEDFFQQTQKKIAQQKKLYGKYYHPTAPHEFMLRGVVRCSCCGGTLTLSGKKSPGLNCHYYLKGKCKESHYITLTSLDRLVLSTIENMLQRGDFELNIKNDKQSSSSDSNVDLKLQSEFDKLERVKIAYENGIDSVEEYRRNKQRILSSIDKLEAQRNSLEVKIDLAAVKSAFLKKASRVLVKLKSDKYTGAQKNVLIKTIVEKIVFDRANSSIDIFLYT